MPPLRVETISSRRATARAAPAADTKALPPFRRGRTLAGPSRGGAAIPGPTLIRLACARYLSLSPLSLRDIIPTPLDLRPFPPDRGNRPLDKESRPLLYGFQESLPGLGRGGPWASRRKRTAPQKGTLIRPSVSTGAPSHLKGEGSAGAQCAPLR